MIRSVQWTPVPGQPLPVPLIEDDRADFPDDVVRQLLEWMQSELPHFEWHSKPTDITINLDAAPGQSVVIYHGLADGTVRGYPFRLRTYEQLLRHKATGLIVAHYHYMLAQNDVPGQPSRHIVGPQLRIEQTAQIQ